MCENAHDTVMNNGIDLNLTFKVNWLLSNLDSLIDDQGCY